MLGIENYNPKFFSSTTDIITELSQKLRNLVGKKLLDVWIVIDTNDNTCFKDCPVVLNIEGTQLELCNYKTDELAITFNTIDLSKKINWYDIDDFKLEWRKEPLSELSAVINRKIRKIELIEYNFKPEIIACKHNPMLIQKKGSIWILNGVGFELEDGYFSVFNSGDENSISIRPNYNYNFRTIKIPS